MRQLTSRQFKEFVKLHKLIIHNHATIKDDKEWYRLARKETKAVERNNWLKRGKLCRKGCGF